MTRPQAQPDPVRLIARRQAGPFIAQDKDYRSDFRQGWHEHPGASFDFVLRGGGTGVCGRERVDSVPGAVEFFPAGVRHNFTCAATGIRTLHIIVPSEALELAGVRVDATPPTLPPELFGKSCLVALRAAHEPGDTGVLDLEAAVHELIGLLTTRPWGRGGSVHARRAAGVLTDCAGQAVTLDELADAVGINRGHLAREFRRAHGCSPGEYQRRLRVRKAAGALAAEPEVPIVRVALDCGFVDQAHLTNHFRRAFGLTPARYRALLNAGDAA